MKKLVAAAVTTAFAASMTAAVFADDVSVRTSVGSGEVSFTETSEEVDISAEELTELVKSALAEADDQETLNAFADAEADVTLAFDEENQLEITASAIGQMERNGEDGYASFFYSLDGFGDPLSGKFESYHWADGDTHYTAVYDGEEWTVRAENALTEALEQLGNALESDQAENFSLDALQPNFYEDEEGNRYYVCVYDKDTVLTTAGGIEGAEMYAYMADGILGDNEVQLIIVVNAETGLPRAISLNASGAAGQLPGELLGGEGSIEFSTGDLYATLLLDTYEQEIEIPEEVLNTPVSGEEELDIDLGALLGDSGVMNELGSED